MHTHTSTGPPTHLFNKYLLGFYYMPGPADAPVSMTDTAPALSELTARRCTISQNNPANENIKYYNQRSPNSNSVVLLV